MVTIGSLCSGYGGLDAGIQIALGGQVVFFAEIDPAASKLLEYRFPGIPNLGDLTKIDWEAVMSGKPQLDVLTAGFP